MKNSLSIQVNRMKIFGNHILGVSLIVLALISIFTFPIISCSKNIVGNNDKEDSISYPLLNDQEMLTVEDPDSQYVKPEWSSWIRTNNIPIRSLHSEDFSDISGLDQYLSNKKIIQLGESGHGVKQFSSSKVRLIKYLHEELNFNVIAFESSIFECFYANQNVASFSSKELMANSIFGVWHTAEVKMLFNYLKDTWNTNSPLHLAGFDTQISSGVGVNNRPIFFRNVISKIDSAYAMQIFKLDSTYLHQRGSTYYIENNFYSLRDQYYKLERFFDNNMNDLLDSYPSNTIPMIAKQSAYSIQQYLKQVHSYTNPDYGLGGGSAIRDKGMSKNLIYLAEDIYPNEKIIVWAHNYHIRNNINANYDNNFKTMGRLISEHFNNEVYTLGLYMYRGSASKNNRQIYDIEPPARNSIESIFYTTRKKHCYVDISQQNQNDGNSWMFQQINTKSWGTSDISMILSEQYDGILFIDTVSPPDYLQLSKENNF